MKNYDINQNQIVEEIINRFRKEEIKMLKTEKIVRNKTLTVEQIESIIEDPRKIGSHNANMGIIQTDIISNFTAEERLQIGNYNDKNNITAKYNKNNIAGKNGTWDKN